VRTVAGMTQEEDSLVEVAVWDWPVRVVHWAIALLVAALITTGLVGNEALIWHMRCGETLLALVLFRVAWGFVGSANACFTSFVRGPRAVASYVKSIFRPPHQKHATHNPIGGWMVVALVLSLLFQAGTGLFTNDDILNDGPLVKLVSKDTSDAISSLHRRGWWVVVGLSSLHILAVVAYLVLLRDNLIRPMVSGRKLLPRSVGDPAAAVASTARALVLLAACGCVVWWTVNRL
jgi:cytochrome b